MRPTRRRRPLAPALALVTLPVLVALLGPFVAPHDPDATLGPALAGPGTVGPFGTDQLGRDVFSRVLDGGRTTLMIAAAAAIAAEFVGVCAGTATALSGRLGGVAITYTTRVLLAVPSILAISALVAGFGHSSAVLLVASAVVLVPSLVPVIATQARAMIDQPWAEAAILGGARLRVIVGRELLPNLAPVIASDIATRFLGAIFLVSTAGFLGLGPTPPAAEWGLMISDAEPTMRQQPWPIVVPAALLACLATGITILGHHTVARQTGTGIEGTPR